jgi:hypothetical protein
MVDVTVKTRRPIGFHCHQYHETPVLLGHLPVNGRGALECPVCHRIYVCKVKPGGREGYHTSQESLQKSKPPAGDRGQAVAAR